MEFLCGRRKGRAWWTGEVKEARKGHRRKSEIQRNVVKEMSEEV